MPAGPGPVQPLAALDRRPARPRFSPPSSARWPRSAASATRWPAPARSEEMGVVGLSLQLAARAPAPSFVFLVGDRPVDRLLGLREGGHAAACCRRARAASRTAERRILPVHHPVRRRAPRCRCRARRHDHPVAAHAAPGAAAAAPPAGRRLAAAQLLPAEPDPGAGHARRAGRAARGGGAARSPAGAKGRLRDRAVARQACCRWSCR